MDSLVAHAHDYKKDAWKAYTLEELGNWVHLLAKRSTHRADPEKRRKDLDDAKTYWDMMGLILSEMSIAKE